MKYIRTKHFVVELATWMKIGNDILLIGGAIHKIVKQADTIEELCDEFVIVGLDFKKHIVCYKQLKDTNGISYINERGYNAIYIPDLINKLGCEIYGAIWTEWGLKYVAKMNEKGELELL